MKLNTKGSGNEMSWSFGPCSSEQKNYENHRQYTERCCVAPGEYTLTCKDSFGDGWGDAFMEIEGQRYCSDFSNGIEATVKVSIEGMNICRKGQF